ncbi:unnamed protein product, partial [Rotaria sp. Silwood2]
TTLLTSVNSTTSLPTSTIL